jgi:polar amino acid transport system substrate-binding protein
VSARLRAVVPIVAALTAGALSLSACSSSSKSSTPAGGGGSSSGGAPTSASAPVSSAPVSAPASSGTSGSPADLVPASIKSKGTLTVAVDATYPPDESVASNGKDIVGMDADMAKAIGAELGLKVKLVNVTFDSIIPRLQSGTYDMGMSSFTDNKTREKIVDFVTYFQAGEGFYVKSTSNKTFNGLSSLCGAKVAVESGTTEQSDAQAQGKKCKVTVLSFSDQNGANLAVSSGRADVGFVDSQVAGYIAKQSNGQFKVTGTAFEVAPYGIALPKGNGMAPAVLAAVKALIANGTYTKVLTTWGVQAGAVTDPVINGAVS